MNPVTEKDLQTAATVKRRFPYLSRAGIEHAILPTEYYVEYLNVPAWDALVDKLGDEDELPVDAYYDNVARLDARTLAAARRIIRRLRADPTAGNIRLYQRRGISWYTDGYGGYVMPFSSYESEELLEEYDL